MSEELKPCPMCGGKAYYKNTVDFTSVRCRSCQLETKLHNDQEGALCAWNRRVNHIVDADKKVPEGYVIVPVEPTEEMVNAAHQVWSKHRREHASVYAAGGSVGHLGWAESYYRAMIKAAQKQGE